MNVDLKQVGLNRKRPNKSVTFYNAAKLYRLRNVPLASTMTYDEKKVMWHTPNEIEEFKRDAATVAGVKLVRFQNNFSQSNFVMVGNFDDCETNDERPTSCISSDVAIAGNCSSFPSDKYHYNVNEYYGTNKRGLGFHFSRTRKRARIMVRSAIMTWQSALSDPSNRKYSDWKMDLRKNKFEKSQFALSLVSAKCSSVSREEARWRGRMDYLMAHPESNEGVKKSALFPTIISGDYDLSMRQPTAVKIEKEAILQEKRRRTLEEDSTRISKKSRDGSYRSITGKGVVPSTFDVWAV